MTHPNYVSYPYIYSSKGVNARNTIDRLPPQMYWNLQNAECRQEGSVASRLGRIPVSVEPTLLGGANAPIPTGPITTLARLKGLTLPYRYVGGGSQLYRGSLPEVEQSPYVSISGPYVFSGQRFSTANYRPNDTSIPYIFFADQDVMVKDNGSLSQVQLWGIFPPVATPLLTLGSPLTAVVDDMEAISGSYNYNGMTGPSSVSIVNTTLGVSVAAGQIASVAPASMANIVPNALLNVGTETDVLVIATTSGTFTAFFAQNHTSADAVTNNGISGTIASSGGLWKAFTGDLSQANYGFGEFTIGITAAAPADAVELTVAFNVTASAFTLGSSPGNYVARVSLALVAGYQEISIPVSSFMAQGLAGTPNNTWADIKSWWIGITNSASTTITIGDFSYVQGQGPSIADGGATAYDYRVTFYNSVTGTESGPSVVMAPKFWVNPLGQPVILNLEQFQPGSQMPPVVLDPQVTDIRIYRRGGTLPNQWLQVGQVPIGTTTFTDTMTDEQIATANILDVDTAPPVTSTLPIPLNVTITPVAGAMNATVTYTGTISNNLFVNQQVTVDPLLSTQETVIVYAVDYSAQTFSAYFQYAHANNAVVTGQTRSGQPCNIATIAFNRAWVAGDPNNPDLLYYSDTFNPESFPVENFLEIGTPSDPIMAVMEWNGQLYVFTQNTVWNILGAQGGTTPLPYKTAAKHGLNAHDAWAITEGEIVYQAFGGIYAFQGSDSRYASSDIEWVFTAQFVEDDIPRDVVLMDPDEYSETCMAYYQNEVYVSYIGQDANRHRVIYDKIHNRWRNDDVPADAMLVQDDVYTLIYGNVEDDMIYQDRIGNYDSSGSGTAPETINFEVQTAAQDLGMPKNFKNFNEVTIDIDTGGLPVGIACIFDYGETIVGLGNIVTNGRKQVDLKINGGQGYLSLNVSILVSALISSNISSPVELYEAHIRAVPEAELRQSYDSYLMDFGTPDYKFTKQGWFEYTALDPAGVLFQCFVDGVNVPQFSFTLPQSLTRANLRVRFPATKARVWRWVASSSSDFRLYSDSWYEWKPVTQDKGYQKQPVQQEEPKQP